MSGHHLSLVLSLNPDATPELTGPAMAVLQSHAWHANDAALSWPSVDLVKRETRLSLPTITRAHKLLIDHGWLARKRRHNTSTIYRLNVAKLEHHRLPQTPRRDPFEGLLFAGESTSDQGINHSEGATPLSDRWHRSERGVVPITLRGSTDQSEHLSSIEDSKKIHPSEAGVGVGADGTKEGTPSSHKDMPEPSAEALAVLAAIEWGEHKPPSRRQRRELGQRLDAAAFEGLSWRALRRHVLATVRIAKPVRERGNAVSFLLNGLTGDNLPAPELVTESTAAAGAVPRPVVAPSAPNNVDGDSQTMSQETAKAAIDALLAGRRSHGSPKTALSRP